MTDNDNVSRSAQTLPCGHQHKPGTRFCTVCGVPVPAQISAQDAFGATQTVQARDNLAMPGGGFGGPVADLDDTSAATRLRPRVPRESDPSWQAEPPRSWQPGEDWQPGPEWQQPQQQWQQPQQQWQPSQDWQDWQQPAQPWQAEQQAQQSATPWDQQGGQWQQPAAPWEQQPQWGQSGGRWQQSRPIGQPSNAFPAAPPATAGRSRMPVIAGIVLAAVLLGGGTGSYLLLAHHNPPATNASNSGTLPPTSPASTPLATTTTTTTAPPTTTPPTTPATGEQQAATNLANLLQQSVSDRNAINQAYNDVLNCGSLLGQDQQTFQQAASSRQSLISQVSSLPGAAALPAQTLSDLTSAWQASATVDQDYAQWAANENSNGCVANDTSNSNYVAAEGPNGQATTSKTAFVSLWNPIAQKYGLTQYSQDQL